VCAAGIWAGGDSGSRKSGHKWTSKTIVERGSAAIGSGRHQVIEKAEEILFGVW
jgi:hypothetical protein